MNHSFGNSFRKDKDYKQESKTERSMESEYDVRVEEYHKLLRRVCCVNIKTD